MKKEKSFCCNANVIKYRPNDFEPNFKYARAIGLRPNTRCVKCKKQCEVK